MIEIYGTPTCGFCKKAVALAEQYALKYTYKDVTADETYMAEFKEKFPNQKSVPQIMWNGNWIGGYNQLAEEIQNTRNFGQESC
jgi:glutaredoxin